MDCDGSMDFDLAFSSRVYIVLSAKSNGKLPVLIGPISGHFVQSPTSDSSYWVISQRPALHFKVYQCLPVHPDMNHDAG